MGRTQGRAGQSGNDSSQKPGYLVRVRCVRMGEMMSTFTPGPWKTIGQHLGSEIIDSNGDPIAGTSFVYGSDKEAVANANLISAATDLFDAVKKQNNALNKLIDKFGQPSVFEIAIPAIMAGDAAIYKAEGGK